MSEHLTLDAKKVAILSCQDEIAIDYAYKAMKEALKRAEDTSQSEFDLSDKTISISGTVSLIKTSKKSKTYTARIKLPNEKNYRRIGTGESLRVKAEIKALQIEANLLAKLEAGTLDIDSELSWLYVCSKTMTELNIKTEEAVRVGLEKGKKRSQIKPQSQVHSSMIRDKLKDNKFLKGKKITNIDYADFIDAFTVDEIVKSRGKTTLRNLYRATNLVFEYALRNRLISENQIPKLPTVTHIEGQSKPVITPDDMDLIMGNFQHFYESSGTNYKTRENRRFFPFYITFVSSCGLRPGEEAINIKWSHLSKGVLPDNNKVTVYFADIHGGKLSNRTKDGGLKIVPHSREIVIYPETSKAIEGLYFLRYGVKKTLAEIVDEGRDDLMFIAENNRQIAFSDVLDQYMTYLKDKISIRYTQYSFRHEFINSELNKGTNIQDVADQCGTSVRTIEKHYKKYKAMRRVERVLSKEDIEYFEQRAEEENLSKKS